MVGHIDAKVTRGLLWLGNEIQVTAVTVHPKKGESISLDPINETTKLIPTIKNGKWKITAKITSEDTIVQNGSNPLDVMSPIITKRVEKGLEEDIKQNLKLTLIQVKQGMNVDAFGFADAFHRKYPKEWAKWLLVIGITVCVVLIVLFKWPKMEQNQKKEKIAFLTLTAMGWLLAILLLFLPDMPGPTQMVDKLFKPLGKMLEK